MNKIKIIAGMLLFGSLWGFSECIIGPALTELGLPSGILMTSIFGIGFLLTSRLLFQQRGMQVGIGIIAGLLRLFNPFGGCIICSSIAIAAEGALFELIWFSYTANIKETKSIITKIGLGIISSYICYVGGYIVTQILTPIVSTSGFYLNDLLPFIPQILAKGLLAALIGGATVPAIFILKDINISSVKDKVYYPTTAVVSALCWFIVILAFIGQ
jgi:hypothetical protein